MNIQPVHSNISPSSPGWSAIGHPGVPEIVGKRDLTGNRTHEHQPSRGETGSTKPVLLEDRHPTALLVDDEPAVRSLVESILTTLGYRVIACGDGAEALRFADLYDGVIDLLVTDLVMPHVGGMELARKMRELRPDLPILLMSGFSHDKQALNKLLANRSGVDFLQKPFRLTELERSLRALGLDE